VETSSGAVEAEQLRLVAEQLKQGSGD